MPDDLFQKPADDPIGKTGQSVDLRGKDRTEQNSPDFQVRQADTIQFASLDGLEKASGLLSTRHRRLALKEYADDALDAADRAGRHGEVEVRKLGANRYLIVDLGLGIPGGPDGLAALYSIGREMVSSKFWRLPSRGCLGNGLRIAVGIVAATGGTIEVWTHGQRVLLHPRKAGHTQVLEVEDAPEHTIGTKLIVTFGDDLPEDSADLSWAEAAVAIAQYAGPPYERQPNPHWMDADHIAKTLSTIEPADTTVREFVAKFDGCTGTAGRIASLFDKGKLCRDLTEAEAYTLLEAAQSVARTVKPESLKPVGPDAFDYPDTLDAYIRRCGTFRHGAHRPFADIPFIVECWCYVDNRTGHDIEIEVYANRTPVVDDVAARRSYYKKAIRLSGAGLDSFSVDVKLGDCRFVLHITTPFIPILSYGKRADFSQCSPVIAEAMRLAFNRSRDLLPPDPKQPKQAKPERDPKPPKLVHVPTTPLGILIARKAWETGFSEDDLTVMSRENDSYRFDNPGALLIGKWFADNKRRLIGPRIIHIRGCFYIFVSKADLHRPDNGLPFVNTDANWRFIQKAAKAARWNRLIRFDEIGDERSDAPELFAGDGTLIDVDEPMNLAVDGGTVPALPPLRDMLPSLSVSGGPSGRQPYRLALIGEKSSLSQVLRPLAMEYDADLLLFTGNASDTHIAALAARAAADGRPLIVLYFADFDPSGFRMPREVARKLQALRDGWFHNLEFELHRVGLTFEQVREFALPSTPLKRDKNGELPKSAEKWKAKWDGHEQTEIDALAALEPELFEQITRDAIRPFFDETLADRVAEAQELPDEAAVWFEALPEYRDAVAEITGLHGAAGEAIAALSEAHGRHVAALRTALDNADDAPALPDANIAPQITATAPPPLFSTDWNWVEATRRLIADRELSGEDAGDDNGDDEEGDA